ncbi:MAG: ATP-grasp domain-containing protein [Proteobacteria bacterium]|nr:ATP-grasp domain-containing protein [Pseudomonadota bacterium]
MQITKILIANRGEISCRIIETCRRMKIRTVAIYSDSDRHARHVLMADESAYLGASDPSESYLNIEKIIDVAKTHQVDAIHPGYGFLSERGKFAQAVKDSGLIFIGAPIEALELMGSKSAAKLTMEKSGVPCVPGYHGDDQTDLVLYTEAKKIGFPVLIKAVSGGGGKGMKIVEKTTDFKEMLLSAQREAQKAFGDDRVILEKYIRKPKHIEVQVFADSHGQIVHLYERDCSTQRRYQKIIEEAPAAGINDVTRTALLNAAISATNAIDYQGAGTIEFLLDEDERFYFMEMNTRLQVEHRVTEMITGVDLVEWQILIAQGDRLPLSQMNIQVKGHAIQARLYAEDPMNGFLPSTGLLQDLYFAKDENVLIDTAVEQGDAIGIHYDPMMAKVVVWAEDRDACIKKLRRILNTSYVFGVKSNLTFLTTIINSERFAKYQILSNSLDKGELDYHLPYRDEVSAIYLDYLMDQPSSSDVWSIKDNWRMGQSVPVKLKFDYQQQSIVASIEIKNKAYLINGTTFYQIQKEDRCFISNKSVQIICQGERYELSLADYETTTSSSADNNAIISPMPGKIIEIKCKAGEKIEPDQTVLVMEAMKMELSLKASRESIIKKISCQVGDQVEADSLLVELSEM